MGHESSRVGQERARSGPGTHQEWARSRPGVGQERTRSGLGAYREWARPRVGQERTRSGPGAQHEWARSLSGWGPERANVDIATDVCKQCPGMGCKCQYFIRRMQTMLAGAVLNADISLDVLPKCISC